MKRCHPPINPDKGDATNLAHIPLGAPRACHSDSELHLLYTNVGEGILPLLSPFHILALNQYFLQISNVFF